MSFILDTITQIFSQKDPKTKIEDTTKRLNKIVSDLDYKFNKITYLLLENIKHNVHIELLDPIVCNEATFTLVNNITKMMENLDLDEDSDFVYKKLKKCSSESSCKKLIEQTFIRQKNGKKISKQKLCSTIAIHYIKIYNLISALLAQINPLNNSLVRKLYRLYNLIDSSTLKVSICDDKINKLLDYYGMRELLNIYMFELLLSDYSQDEIQGEYNNLLSIFNETLTKNMDDTKVPRLHKYINELKRTYYNYRKKLSSNNKNAMRVLKNETANNNNNVTKTKNSINKNKLENNNNLSKSDKKIISKPGSSNEIDNLKLSVNKLNEKIDSLVEKKINDNSTKNTKHENIAELKTKYDETTKNLEDKVMMLSDHIKELNDKLDTVSNNKARDRENYENLKKKYEKDKKKIKDYKLKLKTLKNETKNNSNTGELLKLETEIKSLLTDYKVNTGGDKTKTKNTKSRSQKLFKDFIDMLKVENTEKTDLGKEFYPMFFEELKHIDKLDSICKNSNKPILIHFDETDTDINEYLNIYNKMTDYLNDETNKMITLLESRLLNIEYSANNAIKSVTIRKVSDIDKLSSEVKKRISLYIKNVNNYYIDAITILEKYLFEKKKEKLVNEE